MVLIEDMRNNGIKERFKLLAYTNRSGSTSWRIMGTKRTGERIRENHAAQDAARCRKTELDLEWLGEHRDSMPQMTSLTESQLRLSEAALARLGDLADLPLAVELWMRRDKSKLQPAPRLDEAVTGFLKWVETAPLRPLSRAKLRQRITIFRDGMPNQRISDITDDHIEKYLNSRKVGLGTKLSNHSVISRFFTWCMAKPQRWITTNPCRLIEFVKPKPKDTPAVLTVDECEALMRAAEAHKGGNTVPYLALALWGGIRPQEVKRLRSGAINLKDGEIRIAAEISKTGQLRIVKMDTPLREWLTAYHDKPIVVPDMHRELAAVKRAAGFAGCREDKGLKRWVHDVARHTSISHYFRKTGSYGLTAEQHGNSETIIRKHYQGIVTSEDTERFYSIVPASKISNIIPMNAVA